MIPPTEDAAFDPPVFEPDLEATYTLDVVAEMTGVTEQTILHYQEQGLLTAPSPFDDEALRNLRRIEHLRTQYEMNAAGLKLMLDLMDEVEHLQRTLRSRR